PEPFPASQGREEEPPLTFSPAVRGRGQEQRPWTISRPDSASGCPGFAQRWPDIRHVLPIPCAPHGPHLSSEPRSMSRGFFRSTLVVGLTTLLSRITGLARDVVYASMVPAAALEVFVPANQIPNLLRRLFAEGAFSQAVVPVVAEYKTTRSTDEVRGLVDSVAGTLGLLLLGISAIGVLAAPIIVLVTAPGFATKEEGQFPLAVEMLRWTFPYVLFVSLTALAGGVLNSYKH